MGAVGLKLKIWNTMANKTKIQWTDETWNIAIGCTKVDKDCQYCYMYRDSLRGTRYNPMEIKRAKTVFNKPLKIKEPSLIFTCSLTDFFHEALDLYRWEAWDIIRKCPQHTFQILTKRPERIAQHLPDFWNEIKGRVWLGTSIGSMDGIARLYDLLESGADCLYFLSLEPLYRQIALPLYDTYGYESLFWRNKVKDALKWVIVGGESGNNKGAYTYRPCELAWIERIVNDCVGADIPVFVKQLGTHLAKQMRLKNDRHGGNIDNFPESLRIRQFPKQYNLAINERK